jgi:hypothetical protein
MEEKLADKECCFCKGSSTTICFKCMNYYCDSCFNICHKDEKIKNHEKEKIDELINIEVRCSLHELVPMNLFCLDDKGNLKYYL